MLRRFGLLAWLALGPLGVAYLMDPVLGAGQPGAGMALFALWFAVSTAATAGLGRPAGRAP